jgi:hypothetical protein
VVRVSKRWGGERGSWSERERAPQGQGRGDGGQRDGTYPPSVSQRRICIGRSRFVNMSRARRSARLSSSLVLSSRLASASHSSACASTSLALALSSVVIVRFGDGSGSDGTYARTCGLFTLNGNFLVVFRGVQMRRASGGMPAPACTAPSVSSLLCTGRADGAQAPMSFFLDGYRRLKSFSF